LRHLRRFPGLYLLTGSSGFLRLSGRLSRWLWELFLRFFLGWFRRWVGRSFCLGLRRVLSTIRRLFRWLGLILWRWVRWIS
jgi:hypothetical protein